MGTESRPEKSMGNCLSSSDNKAVQDILTETQKQITKKPEETCEKVHAKSEKKPSSTDWLQNIANQAIAANELVDEEQHVEQEVKPNCATETRSKPENMQQSSNPMENDIMGGILKAMWPMIQQHIQKSVLSEVEKNVNISLDYVSLIDVFRFTKSMLGTKYPTFSNFRLISSSNKTVVLQLDVEYDGDCEFEMEIGTKVANIPLGIRDVKFKGVLRVELKDLIPTPPMISAIVAYFIQPPHIDFDLTKTANIVDHPMIAKTVRKLVIDGASGQLVNPHRIVVPLGVPDASVYRWPMPSYVAKVTVIEAHDLVNADGGYLGFVTGKSDPYVKVYMDMENQDKTPTITDDLNPKWNHTSFFRVYRDDDDIQFNVFDEDIDADDDLGKAVIKLNEVGDDWQDWVTLQGTEKGKLKLRIQKLYPANPKLKTESADSVRQLQLYVGTLNGLLTEEQSYEKKQQIYEAKIVLDDGTEFPFGAGVYEPKLKQTSATWENAKHMFLSESDQVRGSLFVTVKRSKDGAPEQIGKFDFDLSGADEVAEIDHTQPLKPGHSVNARITIKRFQT